MASSSLKREKQNLFELSEELIILILGFVARGSLADLFNAKLSCKRFNVLGDDCIVYRMASMFRMPHVPWAPMMSKQSMFLQRCRGATNPELLFKLGMGYYFFEDNVAKAIDRLNKAVEIGYEPAIFLKLMILILSKDESLKNEGMELGWGLQRAGVYRHYSARILNHINFVWIVNRAQGRTTLCVGDGSRYHHSGFYYTPFYDFWYKFCDKCKVLAPFS